MRKTAADLVLGAGVRLFLPALFLYLAKVALSAGAYVQVFVLLAFATLFGYAAALHVRAIYLAGRTKDEGGDRASMNSAQGSCDGKQTAPEQRP